MNQTCDKCGENGAVMLTLYNKESIVLCQSCSTKLASFLEKIPFGDKPEDHNPERDTMIGLIVHAFVA